MAGESTPDLNTPLLTRRWTLAAAATATFLVMFDSTAVMMALPGLRAELDITGPQWVVAAHAVPLAAVLVIGGALADRFGHRSAFRLGALLLTGGSVAAGASGTMLMLAIARGCQGIGSAFLLATASTLAAHEYPGPARGRALRLLSTAAALGLALGPAVGGLLAEVDWRLVFLSALPAGVMLLAIGKAVLRDVRPTALEPDLFGNRAFLALMTFLSSATGLTGVYLTTLHLQDTLGHPPSAAGLRLLPLTAALIGATFATGAIVTKIAPGVAVGIAAVLVTLGTGLLVLVTPDSTWLGLLSSMILLGAGMGMSTSVSPWPSRAPARSSSSRPFSQS